MTAGAKQCLEAWRASLPEGRLLPEGDITRYRENCLGLARTIIAIIQPESEAEVATVANIANRHGVALYTVSTGHNWGYGTSLPVVDGCAILDLSRMSRIIDCDRELGLITIEPGVTQKHLADYLAQHHLDFYVPTTGAGPSTSIVGNALEHGFGMAPEEDHFRAVTSVRAVLADGSLYQSAFAEAGATTAGVWKWGVGPYLDGLFAQANMGIVTALQIGLKAKAEYTEIYMFSVRHDEGLKPMLEACRTLLSDMPGVIGHIKLFNRQQLVSTMGEDQVGAGLIRDFAWMGFGVFRCRRPMVPAIRREIRRTIGAKVDQLAFVNAWRNAFLGKLVRFVPGKLGAIVKRQLGSLHYLMDLVNGVPRSDALGLVYQHVPMQERPPVDPVRDGVGVIWYAPVLPMKPDLILDMVAMIREVLHKHGFTYANTFTANNEKCAIGVVPIIYKRPEDTKKAHDCYNELWQRGNALGCPLYRLNVGAMPALTGNKDSVYWQSVGKIKVALDPNHILSPGRYAPVKN